MKTLLAYGKTGLTVEVNDAWNVQVVEPIFVEAATNPSVTLASALRQPIGSLPLASRVKSTDRVGIIFNDITRATPNELILSTILAELAHVPRENITLYNALGTHRPNTDVELRKMLGDRLVDMYRIVQNNSFDSDTQVNIGITSRGNEIWINKDFMGCDFKILTGFIEPHFFAGFSGGGKVIMPGMAGQITILGNHDAANVGDARSTWGMTVGNPLWEEVREVAQQAGADFLVNVTLNRDKAITAVFAGELIEAHAAGCAYVKQTAMAPVDEAFDIVVTSNSGYPLDLNLYQTVKGMSAAAQIVKQGGAILIAAECWDGIPEHGLFGQLLAEASSPEEILRQVNRPGYHKQDQWQAQVLALVRMKADVYVHSTYLSDEQVYKALLKPTHSMEATLQDLVLQYGPQARICILPEGPLTIPYVREKTLA